MLTHNRSKKNRINCYVTKRNCLQNNRADYKDVNLWNKKMVKIGANVCIPCMQTLEMMKKTTRSTK